MHDASEALIKQRVLALIGGPFYLCLLTGIFSQATGASIGLTAIAVIACAFLVLVAIGLLCVRFASRTKPGNQFGMATVLLLFIPFSVYLGAIRCLLMRAKLKLCRRSCGFRSGSSA